MVMKGGNLRSFDRPLKVSLPSGKNLARGSSMHLKSHLFFRRYFMVIISILENKTK